MKRCPFCMGEIHDEAVKCMHCGEWLQQRGSAPSPEKVQPLNSRVEPTELQKKAFKTAFVVVIVLLASVILLLILGRLFGLLPEWEPMQK